MQKPIVPRDAMNEYMEYIKRGEQDKAVAVLSGAVISLGALQRVKQEKGMSL